MGERELRDFVESLNARLVGRSDREIALRFGLTKEEAREILQSCAQVREHPKGLWTYLGGIEPTFLTESVDDIRKQATPGKPVKVKAKVKKSKPAPQAPVDLPFNKWEK